MIAYKLLNRDLTTYKGYQWVVGEKKTASGEGDLCGPGWLHGYEHAELAHFLNPIHANFRDPILYRVEVGGECNRDGQLKAGWTEMTLLEPVEISIPTTEQRVRFAIGCALQIYHNKAYQRWAYGWLDGTDRSREAVRVEAVCVAAWEACVAAAGNCSLLSAAQFAMSERTRP
jgi:hypothetical protein